MNLVEAAQRIALLAHQGDRNKHDGELYLLHVHRVATNIRIWAGDAFDEPTTKTLIAVAWLHDVPEDTAWTLDAIEDELRRTVAEEDLPLIRQTIEGVDGMTKRKGETNVSYYKRCAKNFFSCMVKLYADIVDNFRRNHQITDPETKLRMATKYSQGTDILNQNEWNK